MAVHTEAAPKAEALLDRIEALLPDIRAVAPDAERNRQLSPESARALIEAGTARALVPRRWGGDELNLDTWADLIRKVAAADASHAWCAGLMAHHGHFMSYFPENAQAALWADGPDVAIAGSVAPVATVRAVDGGYRVSGRASFTSGVTHSSWVFIGGFIDGPPNWNLFLIPASDYTVEYTWDTVGMQATGSNTVVTDDVFVPFDRVVPIAQIVDGEGPGSTLHDNPMYHKPLLSFGPLLFASAMLGAAEGALDEVTAALENKRNPAGKRVAENGATQVKLARSAAELDAAALLLARALGVATASEKPTLALRARNMRDASIIAELVLSAVDRLLGLAGTSAFGTENRIQRAWRDVHFAASHISLNTENNLSYWGRMQLGLGPEPGMAMH